MLFKLKERCGPHFQDGETYHSGDTIETHLDLVALHPNKFERNYEAEKRSEAKVTKSKPNIPKGTGDKKKKEDEGNADGTPLSVHGEDITSEFPTAEEVEVKVYVKDNWCMVIDAADGEVLNEKKLRRKEVEEFLAQYLDVSEDTTTDDKDD